MTFYEGLLLTLQASRGMLLPFAVTAAATAVALAWLGVVARRTWVNKRRFDFTAIFFELNRWSCVRLACSWVKLVLVLSYFLVLGRIGAGHYLLLLIPCVMYSVEPLRWYRTPVNLLSSLATAAGVLIASVLQSYIRDMELGFLSKVACVSLCVLIAVYAVYLFVTELNNISQERRVHLVKS